jgi:hypothetical protein
MESGSVIFYFLARSAENTEDKGWTYWRNTIGTKGTRAITFTTGDSILGNSWGWCSLIRWHYYNPITNFSI